MHSHWHLVFLSHFLAWPQQQDQPHKQLSMADWATDWLSAWHRWSTKCFVTECWCFPIGLCSFKMNWPKQIVLRHKGGVNRLCWQLSCFVTTITAFSHPFNEFSSQKPLATNLTTCWKILRESRNNLPIGMRSHFSSAGTPLYEFHSNSPHGSLQSCEWTSNFQSDHFTGKYGWNHRTAIVLMGMVILSWRLGNAEHQLGNCLELTATMKQLAKGFFNKYYRIKDTPLQLS